MMRNLRKGLGLVGVVAGFSTLAAMLTIGCSGDDNNDAGTDSGTDVTTDTGTDVKNDVQPTEAGVHADADVVGQNPLTKFRNDVATAFCNHFKNCCGTVDAGTFDYQQCIQSATASAFNGSNVELAVPEVIARGNVTLNATSSTSCLAGLATLSCPAITSSEVNALTGNCYAAATGTLDLGQDCIKSIECKPGQYCKFAGVDAGTSDGGSTLGQCATLVADGSLCGQAAPYGDPNFLSTECGYKGWHPPAEFCDYDSFDPATYTCQALRANGANCYNDNECASGICGDYGADCSGFTCTCLTTRDFTGLCSDLAIKDGGTD